MLRSFFLAVGLYAIILGAECLVLDKAVLHAKSQDATPGVVTRAYREVVPADWAPWSLLSAGTVVMLYSFTVPAKLRG